MPAWRELHSWHSPARAVLAQNQAPSAVLVQQERLSGDAVSRDLIVDDDRAGKCRMS